MGSESIESGERVGEMVEKKLGESERGENGERVGTEWGESEERVELLENVQDCKIR